MKAALICAILLAGLLQPATVVRSQAVERLAIVIGNNRATEHGRPSLRYADDDAIGTQRLLEQAGVDSTLLVEMDQETRALWPALHHRGATLADLQNTTAQLVTKARAAAARGAVVELMLFYSGHGDVSAQTGEGYVLLSDARLTRTGLSELLTQVAATRNHVVVDACKSFYLVGTRGLGGRRTAYKGAPPLERAMPAQLNNTGFVVSTGSDRESHEWERYHAGILSHELLSALRGAADLDGDRGVSYAELGAFLGKANESILPRFRPDVLVRPPGGDFARTILSWPVAASLELGATSSWGHLYVESADGQRLLDFHPAPERSTQLWIPPERPIFVRRNDESLEYVVEHPGAQTLDDASARAPKIAAKGAINLAFEKLFANPFDVTDLTRFEQSASLASPEAVAKDSAFALEAEPSRPLTPWIAGGSTLLFAGAAALLWSQASSEFERVERWRAGHTQQEVRERQDTGRTLEVLADIAIGLSAVTAVTTAVLFLTQRNAGPANPGLSVGPASAELRVKF